ncbi:MAG: AraC family transcriptional regulator [Fimbriimonas sp.]
MEEALNLPLELHVRCLNVGLHVPPPGGRHPSRKLSCYELIYVRDGRLTLIEHGIEYTIESDEVFVLSPLVKHAGIGQYEPGVAYYWVYFELNASAGAPRSIGIPKRKRVHRPDVLVTLFHRLIAEFNEASLGGTLTDLALMRVLYEIVAVPERGAATATVSQLAARANVIIISDYAQDLSTSNIAERLECSSSYLGRAYRKVYGMNIVDAIHERRMRNARFLLTMGKLEIEEVARKCGFSDSGYFRRIFRRSEGVTPLQYRVLYNSLDPDSD